MGERGVIDKLRENGEAILEALPGMDQVEVCLLCSKAVSFVLRYI